FDVHDRQREVAGGDDRGIIVLARASRTDEAVLRTLPALDLRVLEGGPVRGLVAEASDELLHDLLERQAGDVGGPGVARCGHGDSPVGSDGRCRLAARAW
ncbi:MAG: hypothetical protein ACK559_08585, partial [bacterium]